MSTNNGTMSCIPDGEQQYTAIALKGMPATMHHKCAPDRSPQQGAAVMAGVAVALSGRASMGAAALTGIATEIQTRREREYMLKVRSQLQNKASQNDNIGGFIMLWQDQNANACRCMCVDKYDAVALPIRNHSPFTYPEMKLRARRQMDSHFCCYNVKQAVLRMLVSCIMGAGLYMWLMTMADDVAQNKLGDSTQSEDHMPLADYILMVYLATIFCWGFLMGVMGCMTVNCMLYSPLRRMVHRLNNSAFWKQRGVKFSLTNPGKWCCGRCQSDRKHCIVVQYGLNGRAMV